MGTGKRARKGDCTKPCANPTGRLAYLKKCKNDLKRDFCKSGIELGNFMRISPGDCCAELVLLIVAQF